MPRLSGGAEGGRAHRREIDRSAPSRRRAEALLDRSISPRHSPGRPSVFIHSLCVFWLCNNDICTTAGVLAGIGFLSHNDGKYDWHRDGPEGERRAELPLRTSKRMRSPHASCARGQ